MTSSQTLVSRAEPVPVASKRLLTGHAPLALGISSTIIYITAAFISFMTSFDQWAGREKLTLMLIGLLLPLTLAVIVRRRVETVVGMMGAALILVAPLIGLTSLIVPTVGTAVAGNLAALIPLSGCGVVWAMARNNRPLLALQGVCLVVAVITVFLSGETSAILGLTIGLAFGVGLLWRYRLAAPSRSMRVTDIAVVTLLAVLLVTYLLFIFAPEQMAHMRLIVPDYYRQRFAAWRDTPAIIQDYMYTGSGLGVSAMVLSSYLFIVHVPYLYHVHNLFLQVAIELGIIGMLGLCGMFVAGLWSMTIAIRRAPGFVALCAACILASLVALIVSGMFESDTFADVWVVTMFLSFGFAWVVGQYDASGRVSHESVARHPQLSDILVGIIPFALALMIAFWPGSGSQWLANMGAIAQTRAELTRYRFPFTPIQDELRRDGKTDLTGAIAYYRSALAQNPSNVTALRRLGQIELSQGDFSNAQRNLEAAYQLAPEQRATRQLLGEIYAIQGHLEEAEALWKTVEDGPDQLPPRIWWYEHLGDQQAAKNIRTILEQLDSDK